jgi:hypothetical protein
MKLSIYWEYAEWNYAYTNKTQNFSNILHLHNPFLRILTLNESVPNQFWCLAGPSPTLSPVNMCACAWWPDLHTTCVNQDVGEGPCPHRGTREVTWDIDLKVPKHEIFDGVFFLHKSNLTRPQNTDLERFQFFSKIRQDIRIFDSYAQAQHAHIVTTCMLSISIVLLRVCSV